jgi:hypothetical protein
MVRIAKIIKERNKLTKYLREIVSISVSFERLFFFNLIFLTLIHICACLWIFTGKYDEEDDSAKSWLTENDYTGYTNYQLYMTSVYFTVTTITTVGYGDISGYNTMERFFCVCLMLLGVISFSFATGSLSSLMSTYDSTQASFRERLYILNEINNKHKIS